MEILDRTGWLLKNGRRYNIPHKDKHDTFHYEKVFRMIFELMMNAEVSDKPTKNPKNEIEMKKIGDKSSIVSPIMCNLKRSS